MRVKPFSRYEWLIAWRYLRARREEGGISVMTWISLIGVSLAVFALIATFSIRTGFRNEFVSTVLGINGHAEIYSYGGIDAEGFPIAGITDYDDMVLAVEAIDGVTRAAPITKDFVMATFGERNTFVQIYGETVEDLRNLPGIASPETAFGSLDDFNSGVAIGSGVARELGLAVGDKVTFTSAQGLQTAFGTAPRINAYDVTYIFQTGRYDIDQSRVFLPLDVAQSFFNKEGRVDNIEIMVENPNDIDNYQAKLAPVLAGNNGLWTWRQANSSILNGLKMEDNVMFVLLFILTLIATFNIVSGLIMLVKNKGRDIAILRTIGVTQGGVMRIFFICGAGIGIAGTILGLITGVVFVLNIDPIFNTVNAIFGGAASDQFAIKLLGHLPAELTWGNVLKAVGLSLGLSFIVTIFPARRAARMHPAEALRYE